MQGGLYKLSLKDISGQDHEIEAIGIEKLSHEVWGHSEVVKWHKYIFKNFLFWRGGVESTPQQAK